MKAKWAGMVATVRRWEAAYPSLRVAITVGLTLTAALLSATGFPPLAWGWVPWCSLLPLWFALRRVTHPLGAVLLGLVFGMVYLSRAIPWLQSLFSESMGWYLLLLGALPFALFLGAACIVQRRLPVTVHLFALPVLWVAADFLRCEGWRYQFSWAQLGQTQVTWPGGLALYPLVGVYGVTLTLLLANVALFTLLTTSERGGSARWVCWPVSPYW